MSERHGARAAGHHGAWPVGHHGVWVAGGTGCGRSATTECGSLTDAADGGPTGTADGWLIGAALLALLIADRTGMSKAETERIWLLPARLVAGWPARPMSGGPGCHSAAQRPVQIRDQLVAVLQADGQP